jgi:Flp pilus assembly protein TadD
MKARHLEWARAACDQAMAMKPNKPQPRASVLFNLGLISELHGDREDARDYFKQSLAVRPNDSVQAELDGLDGKTAASNPALDDLIARCEAARDEVEAILAVLEDAKHRGSGQSKEEAIETMQENVPKLKIARAKWTAAVNAVHDPAIVAEHCKLR